MKMKVLGVEKHKGRTAVRFESHVGAGKAMWSSDSMPRVGREYDVEFDVDDVIEKGRNAHPEKTRNYSIASRDDETELNGVIDSLDGDGMSYFRLGDDCLLMIQSELNAIMAGEWLLLRLKLEDLEVYAQD